MEQITNNMQKYENYKEQMTRLKKALNAQFYLEAIFIEYAVIEDRLESIIRHSGRWNFNPEKYVSIETKLKRVADISREKKSIAHKYFTEELCAVLTDWKGRRNKIIHALMKQSLHTEDLQEIAEDGYLLVKQLCSKTTSYTRALMKAEQKRENNNV